MKKLIIFLMPLLLVASMAFAQQTKTAPTKPAKTEQHLKADGTPDKRYKENKTATKKETVHTKKDGTPDKRYKENKDAKKPTVTKKS